MGYVKSRIRELIKESGSKATARRRAELWYNETKRSVRENEVYQTRDRFEPGKIYVFRYNPATENLPWFDQNPVVLAIEQVDGNDLGVNLNLIPIMLKEQLLDDLYSRFGGQIKSATTGARETNANTQRPLRLTYDGMKSYLQRYGYDFAIRQYIPSRKSQQTVVSYNKWPEIALCDFIQLNGATVNQIRRLFNRR
jgi:hypothetical protein